METGAPENVYVLDPTGLEQLMRPDGQPVRAGLEPGTRYDLPDGRGSISFDDLRRWTKLQISTTPGGWFVLAGVLVAIAGLSVSLTVRPRRLFVRVTAESVEVAGLDRVDGRGGLPEAVAALAAACGVVRPEAGTPTEPASATEQPGGTLADDPAADETIPDERHAAPSGVKDGVPTRSASAGRGNEGGSSRARRGAAGLDRATDAEEEFE